MKIYLLLFFFIIFTNCSDNKNIEETNYSKQEYSLGNILSYNNKDTIFIKSRFTDCGEWGGHEEMMKIYRSGKNINLNYTRFEVNCGVRDSVGSIIQKKELNKNILLSNSQKLIVMNYITALMKFQFLDKEISNSGNFFYLTNTKENLKLSIWGNNPLFIGYYNNLMSSLGFPEVIINNE